MKRTLKNVSLAAMMLTTAGVSTAVKAETLTIPVPKAAVVTAFNGALSTTKVHLDNYGSKHGTSWHKDSSYVLLGGSKQNFSVPEQTFNVTKYRKLRHYIDDMSTSNIQAVANGANIQVSAFFESQGEEVKGKCIRKRFGKWKECSLNMERDIHLNNAHVVMSLKPVAYNGSISFGSASASFKTDVKVASRLCQAFKGICKWIEGKIKNELTGQINKQFNNQLNSTALKNKVANSVKNAPGIKKFIKANWKVTKVASSGANYLITVQRPDQINGTSVKSLKLKALKKVVRASCPAKVRFAATVSMKHTVKGKGWLRYENGKKSKVFNWGAGKNKTVKSNATRTIKAKAGKTKKGWAVMVLKWKGTNGKMYTKKSNKAQFTVKCTRAVAGGGIKLR